MVRRIRGAVGLGCPGHGARHQVQTGTNVPQPCRSHWTTAVGWSRRCMRHGLVDLMGAAPSVSRSCAADRAWRILNGSGGIISDGADPIGFGSLRSGLVRAQSRRRSRVSVLEGTGCASIVRAVESGQSTLASSATAPGPAGLYLAALQHEGLAAGMHASLCRGVSSGPGRVGCW
jgi:hypothetical protein